MSLFSQFTSRTATATVFKTIVPSDVTTYDLETDNLRALLVTSAGNVTLVDYKDNSSTFAVQAGQRLDVAPKRVMAATTAVLLGLFS